MKLIKKIKIAIDSPAAAGAGTQAKLISKHYNLFYLDTGKMYRIIGKIYLENNKKKNYKLFKKKILKIKASDLSNKKLLADKIGVAASVVAKDLKIRKIVNKFQKDFAYFPPKKYNGSCLDGRDITYNIIPDADVKFFMTANVKVRSQRRFKELKKLNYKISYKEVYKSIKNRDKNDLTRKISPLKKTRDSFFIDTSYLTKKECFFKIKKIIDKKISKLSKNKKYNN